jgi:D-glucuronyl C5-epimerase-like protein
LFRAGLGLPDYWHPRLELQEDFLSGKICRYPFSMDVKADYPGTLDDRGIPVVYWGPNGEASPSPVNIILYGLGSHDAFIRTHDRRYYEQMIRVLRWLESNKVPLGEGVGWSYDLDLPSQNLKAPWHSSIVQGFALSLLVRAHQLERCGLWAEMAKQTWLGFDVPVEKGGFCREVDRGVIYEEYPGPELDCVFNGMCHGLIGLWEAWQSNLVKEAQTSFRQGLAALRFYLPQFDCDGWSLYSLNSCLGTPFIASPYYQKANGICAKIIGLMAEDQEFQTYAKRWLCSAGSLGRRVTMSLRIGWQRFRYSPSLLHSDKSKAH